MNTENNSGGSTSKQLKIQNAFKPAFKSNCTQDQLNEKIINYICDKIAPFKTGEDESFREIIKILDPNKTGPCYRTVVKLFDEKFQNMLQNLMKELSQTSYVFIATNAWRGNNKNFVAYTASWFDQKMTRNHAVIAVRRLIGRHTFDVVRKEVTDIQKEFK